MADQTKQEQMPSNFQLRPGDGWLFYQTGHTNKFIFHGHIRVDDKTTYQAVAALNTDRQVLECEIRTFGDWKTIAKFELPQIGDKPFVDGEFKIPLDKPVEMETPDGTLKITERKYQVRAFRDSKRKNTMRMQLPQVLKAAAGTSSNAPEVPM